MYLDADNIDCKLGTEFLRTAAQETWAEPAVIPSVDGGGGLPVGRSALALGNPRPATPCSGRRAAAFSKTRVLLPRHLGKLSARVRSCEDWPPSQEFAYGVTKCAINPTKEAACFLSWPRSC